MDQTDANSQQQDSDRRYMRLSCKSRVVGESRFVRWAQSATELWRKQISRRRRI